MLESCSNKPIFNEDQEENDDMDDDFKVDIDSSDDNDEEEKSGSSIGDNHRSISTTSSSWVHKQVGKPVQAKKKSEVKEFYDPNQRNPAFAGADQTNNWELSLMASHFHPSVSHFANR